MRMIKFIHPSRGMGAVPAHLIKWVEQAGNRVRIHCDLSGNGELSVLNSISNVDEILSQLAEDETVDASRIAIDTLKQAVVNMAQNIDANLIGLQHQIDKLNTNN